MTSRNSNNLLRFTTGSFIPKVPSWSTGGTMVNLYANEEVCTCTPLSVIISGNGLNASTFNIVEVYDSVHLDAITLASPVQWDSESLILSLFRPINLSLTAYTISFTIQDLLGNTSPLCYVEVLVSTVYTQWVPYPVSQVCLLDSYGNNTGYKNYTQLVLENSSTSAYIVPLTLKDNNEGDPDYYPPVQDLTSCPYPYEGEYAALTISNNSLNSADAGNFITITSIYLHSPNMDGGSPLTLNILCNIPPGKSLRVIIPSSTGSYTYDGFSLSYTVNGNMNTAAILRYWYQNIGGVVSNWGGGTGGLYINPVTNASPASNDNLPFSMPSTGMVVFCQ
jgi:hypothetical protein